MVISPLSQLPSDANVRDWPLLKTPLTLVDSWAPLLIVASVILFLASYTTKGLIANPWAQTSVQTILDQLRVYAFDQKYSNDLHHRHRATLFRHKKTKFWIWPWRGKWPWGSGHWPWSGWMIPIARSMHSTQKTKTVFLAPPGDSYNAEGIAGNAWNVKMYLTHDPVPDLNYSHSDQDIEDYAVKTFVNKDFVRRLVDSGKPVPVSMMGFPVIQGGEVLGVIVLDSVKTDGIRSYGDIYEIVKISQELLGPLMRHI